MRVRKTTEPLRRMVVLTGAGMSAESGLKTFRDNGGLWEDHRIEDVATPEAWAANPALVHRFYNERRKALLEAEPNEGHRILSSWEERFEVRIITQNVDDLHERAGSTRVLHLHGELRKARSTADPSLVFPIDGWELRESDRCPLGSPLRPHIVWFGEMVEAMPEAYEWVRRADIFIIVGTSLQVYPAAGLAYITRPDTLRVLVDPNPPDAPDFLIIRAGASEGLRRLDAELRSA